MRALGVLLDRNTALLQPSATTEIYVHPHDIVKPSESHRKGRQAYAMKSDSGSLSKLFADRLAENGTPVAVNFARLSGSSVRNGTSTP